MIPAPVKTSDLLAGTTIKAGLGHSTILPDMDFETYSPAGFVWNELKSVWGCLPGTLKKGLRATDTARYAEHPETEVLCLAYDLKDGRGKQQWKPGEISPLDLFNYLRCGGLIEAWNSTFEFWIWNKVCVPKYGWPPLPLIQMRDAMAKARAHALPGSLDSIGNVLKLTEKKDKQGKNLIQRFCIPRKPSKNDSRTRIIPSPGDEKSEKFWAYNIQDIIVEAEASSLIPDLSSFELKFWLCDQTINARGVQIDAGGIQACIKIIKQLYVKYNTELQIITNGEIKAASEIQKIIKWLTKNGLPTTSLGKKVVIELLTKDDLTFAIRRVLEIRQLLNSAAVKKLYAMANQVSSAGRLHNLFIYHAARTGRAAGAGPQPQNLPNSGPDVLLCFCGKYYHLESGICPWCGFIQHDASCAEWKSEIKEWNADAVEQALSVVATKSLALMEYHYGDNTLNIVSGCLRGLFIAAPGYDLLCSDYSAIEAVVLAALAGEEWRLEVFRTHGKIYEMSAAKITGIPFEEFEQHKHDTGQHHPMRKKIGKVAELASGYQGWLGAWKQFGADKFFNDEEIKQAILAWRRASPAIVAMWGGQKKNWKPEMHGLEGAAISAVLQPGVPYSHCGITYQMHRNVLYCQLLSGRYITYHNPQLSKSERGGLALSFDGWNTNLKNGAKGWVRMYTYGGRLTVNIVQATARDILAYAIVNLEKAGYPVVLHVHDEIVCEVPEGFGSLEEFENIMAQMPAWAKDWPIKASNGWRGKRYRK